MKIRLILVAMMTVFLAAACAPEPQILSDELLDDTSLISDQPCAAPCWRGITPGETSWNDALEIIENDENLSDLDTRTNDDTGQIGATWAQTDGANCCQMFSEDGETVELLVAQTTPDIELAEVIEKYGEPSYLIGETVTSDQALMSVYYPDVPMLIYVFVAGEDGEISEMSEVVGFAYTTPDLMELLLVTSNLYEWSGFDTFVNYIDEDYDVTPSVTITPGGED
jgi:hypothetical protein